MKPSIVILVLLIGAFVLGDIAAVMYVDATNQHWPDLPGIFLLGLTFGQLMLLSAWFVFVRWNIAMRVLIVIAAVFGLSLVVALSTRGANAIGHWFAILLVAFCTAAVPTTVTRCFRWQINREGKSQSATGMTDWQFSIWGLLSGTTAVAIVMGTAKQVEMPLLVVGEAVVFFSCFALTGLSVLFAGLGIRLPQLAATIAIFVVSVICPLAGMFVGVSGLPQRENPLHWALFGFCYGATI
ncbi:MAG: hypothetical protein QGG09_20255, partial [Pirellulaceae bacterium]|nr:hypothetical protein [Pirellulaceae bacterium]